ncbi:MAG: superinfection immunity protein [Wenzhouxiangella sp.]|nr:MAG: superinfection immunity protein [Wenzhouxiangella sp.]
MLSYWTLFGQLFTLLMFLSIYALPSIIALVRRHPKRWPIVAVNLIGGLFAGIGWVAAMVWCFVDVGSGASSPVDELERLERLMERGSLTRDEFERQKQLLLQSGAA